MIKICYHKSDFGLEVVSYNVFSTSHGKNACNDVGAAVKRLARRASIQNTTSNHILNSTQIHNHLNGNSEKIRYMTMQYYIQRSQYYKMRKKLE